MMAVTWLMSVTGCAFLCWPHYVSESISTQLTGNGLMAGFQVTVKRINNPCRKGAVGTPKATGWNTIMAPAMYGQVFAALASHLTF